MSFQAEPGRGRSPSLVCRQAELCLGMEGHVWHDCHALALALAPVTEDALKQRAGGTPRLAWHSTWGSGVHTPTATVIGRGWPGQPRLTQGQKGREKCRTGLQAVRPPQPRPQPSPPWVSSPETFLWLVGWGNYPAGLSGPGSPTSGAAEPMLRGFAFSGRGAVKRFFWLEAPGTKATLRPEMPWAQ